MLCRSNQHVCIIVDINLSDSVMVSIIRVISEWTAVSLLIIADRS
jgi:hypothetical protein